jgi:hypothetical protein
MFLKNAFPAEENPPKTGKRGGFTARPLFCAFDSGSRMPRPLGLTPIPGCSGMMFSC